MKRRAFLRISAMAPASCLVRAQAETGESSDMPAFPITDTHVHFWDPGNLEYPWIRGSELLERPYLPEDYAEAIGDVDVEQIVFVQAACLKSQAMDEVDWVTSLADQEPRIRGIVADAPLELGEDVEPILGQLAENRLVKGVRRMVAGEKDPEFMLQPGFVRGVQLLGENALTCDLGIHRGQIVAATALAKQCPNVKFMLCHIGVPDIKNRQLDPWRDHVRSLAGLPNVWCKLSGVATAADHAEWTPEDLRPAISHTLDCFGFERTAFGSDWPVMLLATSFPRWFEAVAYAIDGCSESEQSNLFRDTACGFYRLVRDDGLPV